MLEQVSVRNPARNECRIIAVFSYRYDAHLVPALIANLTPLIHGYVSLDDRNAQVALSDEPTRRNLLHQSARDMGADWILAVDPDERFENALADRIGLMTSDPESGVLWEFNLREMFSPTAYRVDGIWGGKTQMRLYPAKATLKPLVKGLHGPWVADPASYIRLSSGLNLYHLRHQSAARCLHRRHTYAAADPERKFTPVGYDYLSDNRGMVLMEVPVERSYSPRHLEDHTLWAAPIDQDPRNIAPDPLWSRLQTLSQAIQKGGTDNASHLAADVLAEDEENETMRILAAGLALRAGRPSDAHSLVHPLLETDQTQNLMAKEIASSCQRRVDPILAPVEFVAEVAKPDARWRRWFRSCSLHEGPSNGTGKLCVIVISYQSRKTLTEVVHALRAQSTEIEIVVVNSGGGEPHILLAQFLPSIRLIDVHERMFVGRARNVGIDASRAVYVSFLADDCIPDTGWVASRLARHEAGAEMVASAVRAERPSSIAGIIEQTLIFPQRSPNLNRDDSIHLGRSYTRELIRRVGYFSPDLRIGEDGEFNSRAGLLATVDWAPEIVFKHARRTSLFAIYPELSRRAEQEAIFVRKNLRKDGGANWIQARMAGRSYLCRLAVVQQTNRNPMKRLAVRLALSLALRFQRNGLLRAEERIAAIEAYIEEAKSQDFIKLTKALRRATTEIPQDWTGFCTLGSTLVGRGEPEYLEEGLAALRHANGLAPLTVEPVRIAAEALAQNGNAASGLRLVLSALTIAPSSPGLNCQAAASALATENADLAIYYGLKSLLHDPANVRAYRLLADGYLKLGRTAQAKKCRSIADQFADVRSRKDTARRLVD